MAGRRRKANGGEDVKERGRKLREKRKRERGGWSGWKERDREERGRRRGASVERNLEREESEREE